MTGYGSRALSDFPTVTAAQMREVDRLMVDEYGIALLQMMENAGRGLACLTRSLWPGSGEGSLVVLAGTGGNGGGVLAAARHLANADWPVRVVLAGPPERYQGASGQQLAILQRMDVPILDEAQAAGPVGVILDGLLGYSLSGIPRGRIAGLIEWANQQSAYRLANDLPSGLAPDTGQPLSPCLQAHVTLTLALPKIGLTQPQAAQHVGELYLADIGVPPALYTRPTLDMPRPPVLPTQPLKLQGQLPPE